MRIPGTGRVKRGLRSLRNRLRPGVLVLLYHRVVELDRDPYRLCVTPGHFAEHLEVLQRRRLLMSLRDLIRAIEENSIPRRAVVMTFDDGYADNLEIAKPLLERSNAPATLYVVSGNVGHHREFWWDELDRLLLEPGNLPGELELDVNGMKHQWSLEQASRYSETDAARARNWHLYQDDDPSPRHSFFRSVHKFVRSAPAVDRWRLLDRLAVWAGRGLKGRGSHRVLDRNELKSIASGDLLEVGAHTVSHPVLSSLPEPAQRMEIRGSKSALQDILGVPVTSFAYPHGSRQDYTPETVNIAREEGFESAVSVYFGKVNWGADRYQLPRVPVEDCGGEEFDLRLKVWMRS